MSEFMQMEILQPGVLYTADCAKCGQTYHAHEWTHNDPNGAREGMQAGTLRCEECGGKVNPETFSEQRRVYAGRYSAPGYLDATDWSYDTNLRRLKKQLRDLYGSAE
jgi:DNA-directed RNA polymerase subunit RPC12/RpoP